MKTKILSELESRDFIRDYANPVLESPVIDILIESVRVFLSDKRLKITKKLELDIHYRMGGYLILEAKNNRGDYTQVTFLPSASFESEICNILQSVCGQKKCFINVPYEECVKKTAKCFEVLKAA